jgi:anion-transporting  ArsA/GET3 family ATPase
MIVLERQSLSFSCGHPFVGKGSGKTTVAAAFSRHLAASGRRVVAVDDA